MNNIKIKNGMIAISIAGHDIGKYYIIINISNQYIYLVDGLYKTFKNPKKKKIKHVKINYKILYNINFFLQINI